jgi:hypothetical protein
LEHTIPDKAPLMNNGLSWTILRPLMLISKPGTGQYTVWLGMKPPHRVK